MKNLTVFIGDSEDIFIEIVTEAIREECGSECDLRVLASHKAEEILELAEKSEVDLFVLHLNNILFSSGNLTAKGRMQRVVRLVVELKERFEKPIIVLSALSEYAEQAKEAGADFFIKAPFDLSKFRQVMRILLHDGVLADASNADARNR